MAAAATIHLSDTASLPVICQRQNGGLKEESTQKYKVHLI